MGAQDEYGAVTPEKKREFLKLFWVVFVIGYGVIVYWALIETFPPYKDEQLFYAEVERIESLIASGDLDATRDLGYLYLEKQSPIPHPYSYGTIREKGGAILDKWLTGKIDSGFGENYAEDMYRIGTKMFRQDKELAKKWFTSASKHGHQYALEDLETLEFQAASRDREAKERARRMKEERARLRKERENTSLAEELGKELGKVKRRTTDAIDTVTDPIKEHWQEFKHGVSEGERQNGN